MTVKFLSVIPVFALLVVALSQSAFAVNTSTDISIPTVPGIGEECTRTDSDCEEQPLVHTQWGTEWGDEYTNAVLRTQGRVDSDLCSCVSEFMAACPDGYYGLMSTSLVSMKEAYDGLDCEPCPDGGLSTAPTGYSMVAPNAWITTCYLPANTEYSNDAGTYTYEDACYYK